MESKKGQRGNKKGQGGVKKGFIVQFTPKVTEELLNRISMGEHLTQICQLTHMPERQTVYTWLRKHKKFYEAFQIAKECQADTYLDRMIQIAVDCWSDHTLDAANARVAMDCYKWVISKLAPKKYNDKFMLPGEANDTPRVIVQVPPPAYLPQTNAQNASDDAQAESNLL